MKAKRYATILALLAATLASQNAQSDALGQIRELHVGVAIEKQSRLVELPQ